MKRILFTNEIIQKRIKELAESIDKDFKNEEIIFVCVLKGAFIFTADIFKSIQNKNCTIEFIRASSYIKQESSGSINLINYLETDINNKNVIIVEDILDTGLTLKSLVEFLNNSKPKNLKTCVLLDKKARRKVEFEADYIGFDIEDKFVIGYGLDYDEKFRNSSHIYYLSGK